MARTDAAYLDETDEDYDPTPWGAEHVTDHRDSRSYQWN